MEGRDQAEESGNEQLIYILGLIAAPSAIATVIFALELLFGLRRSSDKATMGDPVTATILIPAHNESGSIGSTIKRLVKELPQGCAILVVADNCHDSTANEATAAGAVVIERNDADHRGKGFALAFGRDHLSLAPPDVVIILDADCAIDRQSLIALANAASASGRPGQAINLLRPTRDGSPMTAMSGFAFLIKNLVRQRGLQRLAGTVHLTGTGMALPWPIFKDAPLATASIVEDMKLGLDLAGEGKPVTLVPNAHVWSDHASKDDTLKQRSRWEGGFLSTARALAPMHFRQAMTRLSLQQFFLALDLCVPPLALLLAINSVVLATLVGTLLIVGQGKAILIALASITLFAALLLLIAWWREGRAFIRISQLGMIPFYVLWKLPMYFGLFRNGIPDWVRAKR